MDGIEHHQADAVPVPAESEDESNEPGPGLFSSLLIYSLLRIGLLAVLAVGLAFVMPFIVAAMFAIVLQLPVAWLLFRGPRLRATRALAESSAERRAERAKLEDALAADEN